MGRIEDQDDLRGMLPSEIIDEIVGRDALLDDAYAVLRRIERVPEETVAGTIRDFCGVCKRALDPRPVEVEMSHGAIRPDGHQIRGGITFRGPCPLALLLDRLDAHFGRKRGIDDAPSVP